VDIEDFEFVDQGIENCETLVAICQKTDP